MKFEKTKGLYELLDVPKDACKNQINLAYLKKSFQYFSQENPGSKALENFISEGRAWMILANLNTRESYDEGSLSLKEIFEKEYDEKEIEFYKKVHPILKNSFGKVSELEILE